MSNKYQVPHSECAMHMRIAGKSIVAYRTHYTSARTADVWIAGQDPYQDVAYSALVSEVLPCALHGENTQGQIVLTVASVWDAAQGVNK